MIIKGVFVSIWDGGKRITTLAELNTETGEVSADTVDVDVDIMEYEYFEDSKGEEYPVCPECHEYILHTCMEPGIAHNLDEVKRCKNPDCDYAKYV